jgi:hypothetical protein
VGGLIKLGCKCKAWKNLKIEKIDVHPTITTIIENDLQPSSTSIGVVTLRGCTIASISGKTLGLKQQTRLQQKELGEIIL